MTKDSPIAKTSAESISRRKTARLRVLAGIPLLLLMAYRSANFGDVNAAESLWALGVTGLIIFVSGVGVFTMFHRRLRRVAALAGPGGGRPRARIRTTCSGGRRSSSMPLEYARPTAPALRAASGPGRAFAKSGSNGSPWGS